MGLFTDDLTNDVDHLQKTRKVLRLSLIILVLILVTMIIFLTRYFLIATQTDKVVKGKINTAVNQASQKKEAEVKAEYEKRLKDQAANPWTVYQAEDVFGAFSFKFPKNWHTSVLKDGSKLDQLRFLADPEWFSVSPGEGPYTALEVKVINKKYTSLVEEYEGEKKRKGTYKISDTSVSNISGKRLEWKNTATDKKAVFVILPFRDKTVYIGTEKYSDLNSTFEDILKNFILNK